MPEVQLTPRSRRVPALQQSSLGGSEAYCRDLTRAAREGGLRRFTLRPVVHRQVVALVTKMDKPTVVLTGQAGVGKSSNVYALAQQMADGHDVPPDLARMRVLELDIPAFLAGPGLEERCLALLRDAANVGREVLLFVDEAHVLLEARAGAAKVGDVLKPSLARGEICCIAATTDEGYRACFEPDEALARRFQRVIVPEPGEQETVDLLLRAACQTSRAATACWPRKTMCGGPW